MFDNPAFDLVRLILSVSDIMDLVQPENDRSELIEFCRDLCTTNSGRDLLEELNERCKQGLGLLDVLEMVPRAECTKSTPQYVIEKLAGRFKTAKAPDNIVPFPLK